MTAAGSRTLALVARAVDYGEADRVLTLLTLEWGKVSAIARSARSSRRRFGGALSLFVLGEAALKQRPRGELLLLERFGCREDFSAAIGRDVLKVAHGSYLLELARDLWPAGQQEPGIFELTVDALRALAHNPPSSSLLRAYELQLLAIVGLVPSLQRCVVCGAEIAAGPTGFSVTQGGVICGGCGGHGWPLSAEARQQLLALSRTAMGEAARVTVEDAARKDMRDMMLMVVQHHLGKRPRSWDFASQLGAGG